MSTQRRPSATIAKVLDTATVSDEVLLAKRTKLQKEYDAILHQLEDLGYHQYTIVIDQFQKLAEIEAASAMSISLCNWVLGNGISNSKYAKYFLEEEEEFDNYERSRAGGKDTKLIDAWLNDEVYSLNRLIEAEYNEKTVWRLLSYYSDIESRRFKNNLFEDIYVDLSSSIKRLTKNQQHHIVEIISGVKASRNTLSERQKAVNALVRILNNEKR